MRRLAAVVVPLLGLALATPAQAATYTSTGVRCTKVGTSHNDVLKGTTGRDVLCGLGGNDRLIGGSGDDVLDGGSGNDAIDGGIGNDVLLGVSGNDTLSGSVGADRLVGGAGNDVVSGGDGNDKVAGGDGNDKVAGDSGNDTVTGDAGDDVLTGSYGRDSLSGGAGNDDLDGGADADGVHGDAGTNWCIIDASDTRTQCVYDQAPPTVVDATATPGAVDVTGQDVTVLLRAHLQDDTGVTRVQLGLAPSDVSPSFQGGLATLVSGTVRDGWWQLKGVARRYGEPGTFPVDVAAHDRVGRSSASPLDKGSLTVHDDTPDRTRPDVTAYSASTDSVDVRSSNGSITITAHLTDQGSGSDPGDVLLCLNPPSGDGTYNQLPCVQLARISGDRLDGDWRVTAVIPRGSVGGDWNASLWVTDAVHRGSPDYFWGPDVYRYQCNGCSEPRDHRLPNGAGRFSVIGSTDSYPAVLESLRADNPDVDTLAGPATVTVDVRATDAQGEGVTGVTGYLTPEGGSGEGRPSFRPVDARLIDGTPEDGTWRLVFEFPQGTPPGRYPVSQVFVRDRTHSRSYAPPNSPYAGQSDQQSLAPDRMSRADASGPSWDGVITVVQHNG
jgi:hypothetical protein